MPLTMIDDRTVANDVIAVLEVIRGYRFQPSGSEPDVRKLCLKAMREAAQPKYKERRFNCELTAKYCIRDACSDRLGYTKIAEFYRDVDDWLRGRPDALRAKVRAVAKSEAQYRRLSEVLEISDSPLDEDLHEIRTRNVDATTKAALVNARKGQGAFRKDLLQLWGNRCAVTGSVTQEAIRASHIKPWRESTDEERLDPYNGLPLVANLDALFDAGLISFDHSGKMIISPKLNNTERGKFCIIDRSLRKKPSEKTAEYLACHRAKCFKN